jgi:Tol biopolymer transport system component
LAEPVEPVSYVGPTWSPDGRRLAFLEWRPGGPISVRVANEAGTTSQLVESAPGIAEVRWSPRGNVLAYSWARAFEHPPYYLAVVELGIGQKTLAPGLDIGWSPDAKRLAFVGGLAGGAIETIRVDGRQRKRLTRREYNSDPAWAPNGSVIAFTRRRSPGGAAQLYLVRSDGRSLRPITRRHSCCPSWSPDGARLVFIGRPQRNSERTALYIVRRDGKGERRITPSYTPLRSFQAVKWSPRGAQILFVRSTGAGSPPSLGLATPAGRIRYIGTGQHPEWSPNGRAIVVTDDCADGTAGVFVVNANGSGRRPITPCASRPLAAYRNSLSPLGE